MKFTPHKYQERAIKFILERACAGLFLSPGLGKTSITFAAFEVLRAKKLVKKMLVLAPLRVCYSTWPAEGQKWDEFQHLSVGILHGANKAKVLAEDHDIYVMNYEGLKWLEAATRHAPMFDVLVIDESSKLKHTNTQRFKTLKKMLSKFKRRYILTGSPAANSLLDLFGQVFCMDQGATFGPFISHYRDLYFFQTGFGGYEWKLKPNAAAQIQQLLAPRVMRMAAEDYLDMPELIKVNIIVDLPEEAQLQYLQMEKKLQIEVQEGKVTAVNAAVAAGKCRQIASGSVYDEQGDVHIIHSAKVEALQDLVEELEGQPLLVAYEYTHEAVAINKAFGGQLPIIGGGMTTKQGADIIDAWNRGEIPLLLAQSGAISHGVNLQQGGSAICWFTLTYNLETYEQFIARVYRQGQAQRVFVYHLVANKTIDTAVLAIVAKKDKQQQSLLTALASYWNA
jgi:SNF2 family DNA or RNA helicase